MDTRTKYILSNYQHLMSKDERLVARWLTEDWDNINTKLPSWLKNRVFESFPRKLLDSPNEIGRLILLRILKDHKSEVQLNK